MSTIDLIILGSLCQSPKSAYDLQKQIEARNLSRWVKIGSFTVYKKVVQYETKGYVTSETQKNGNMPEKIKRICKLYDVAESEAAKMITDTDKRRMANYNFYTEQKWGMACNYTLSLNSSQLGYEKCMQIIIDCI